MAGVDRAGVATRIAVFDAADADAPIVSAPGTGLRVKGGDVWRSILGGRTSPDVEWVKPMASRGVLARVVSRPQVDVHCGDEKANRAPISGRLVAEAR